MTKLRLRRIFWMSAAAIVAAAALVALGAVVRGGFSDTDGRILVTLAALLYTGGAAFSGLALVDHDPRTAPRLARRGRVTGLPRARRLGDLVVRG